jgi:hypothetical protein
MMLMRIDGGSHSSRPDEPSPPPPPPPPKREQEANARQPWSRVSADAAERAVHAQRQPQGPAANRSRESEQTAAAQRTDREVTQARAADRSLEQVRSSPTLRGPIRRIALDEAQATAHVEWSQARTAIRDELALAKRNALPEHYVQYGIPDSFEAKQNEIIGRLGSGNGVAELVQQQGDAVDLEADTRSAVTLIQDAATRDGLAGAARVLEAQTRYVSPELRASIEAAALPTVDPAAVAAAAQAAAAYEQGGALAGARKLDELTSAMTPAQTAQTLEIADATLGRIVGDLGARAETDDEPRTVRHEETRPDVFGWPQKHITYSEDASNQAEFDAIVGHLSATVERAGNDPQRGDSATDRVAAHVVRAMGKDGIGRFDESFETSVVNGNGARLGLAVARQLGNGDKRADDIVQNIVAGAKTLEDKVEAQAQAMVEHNDYYFHAAGELGALAPDEATRTRALENFAGREDGKNFDRAALERDQAELQRYSDALGITLVELSVARSSGVIADGMDHTDDTDKLLGRYADPQAQQRVLSGERVQQKIDGLIDRAAAGHDPSATLLSSLNEAVGTPMQGVGAARLVLKGSAEISLARRNLQALELAKAGDRAGAIALLRDYQGYPFLGISAEDLRAGIRAVEAYDLPANPTTAQVQAENAKLFEKLEAAGFDDQSPAHRLFAGISLGINVLGLGNAAEKIERGDPDGWARMTIGVGDVALAGNDLAKSMSEGFAAFHDRHPVLAGGVKSVSAVTSIGGTVFGWVDFANTLGTGDAVAVGLSGVGAIGSTLATGAQVLGPSGVGVLSGARAAPLGIWATRLSLWATAGLLLKDGYDAYRDTRQYNGQPSQQFLIDLGYSPQAAEILAKQDIHGVGPNEGGLTAAPVLAAAADLLIEQGVIDNRIEFRNIINNLASTEDGRRQLAGLVGDAYPVPRDDAGVPRRSAGSGDEPKRDNDLSFWEDLWNAGGNDYIGSTYARSARGVALQMGHMGLVELPADFYAKAE